MRVEFKTDRERSAQGFTAEYTTSMISEGNVKDLCYYINNNNVIIITIIIIIIVVVVVVVIVV